VNSLPNDELHWLAFRYAAGEMTAGEEQAFELRLADDQQAREAVEQAVELGEALRVVAAEAMPSLRSRTLMPRAATGMPRPATWIAAISACVLVACGLAWLISAGRPGANAPHAADGSASKGGASSATTPATLALEWAAVRQRQESAAPSAAVTPWNDAADWSAMSNASSADVQPADEPIPQWLMIAVSDASQVPPESP
jgi:hypothetical protein